MAAKGMPNVRMWGYDEIERLEQDKLVELANRQPPAWRDPQNREALGEFVYRWVFWPIIGAAATFELLAIALLAVNRPFFSPDTINYIGMAFAGAAVVALFAALWFKRLL